LLSELKANLRRRAKFDVVVVVIVVLLGFIVSHQFDFLEWIYQSSRQYEHYELDEIVPTLLFGVLAFAYFSYRRWHDIKYLSKYLEEQSLTEPVTHIANRRALFGILEQIALENKPKHGFILISVFGLDEIRNKLGFITVEHIVIELLYLLNQELEDDQLIIAWHTGQFIVHAPNYNQAKAHLLAERLAKTNKLATQAILRKLHVQSASTVVTRKTSESELLERLEDNLLD
jgi:GGDEF domain-containing protein